MPRIVTFCPVRPSVTVGTLESAAPGSPARLGAADATTPPAPAPAMAAAFKKFLRFGPPPQTPCARSLMVHHPQKPARTRYAKSRPPARLRGTPRTCKLLCRWQGEPVNKVLQTE